MEVSDPLRIVANLTHELKTPLHAIISTASLLKSGVDGDLNSEQRKQVEIILRNGENLLEMIISLLSFSSTLTETRTLTITKINPMNFIKGIFQQIEPVALKKNIGFNFQNSSNKTLFYTDQDLLNRIVSNILSNAIKFTPENGRVELALMDNKDEGIRIRIADTGRGMSIEAKNQVFNAFYQADSGSTREFGGVGLGLSLVKHAADLIKAKVKVDSELEQGSIFTIDIPNLLELFESKKILMLGVDESLKDSLSQIIVEEGYEVIYINDLDLSSNIQKITFDLVIIDSVLFNANNFEIINVLRSKVGGQNIPILALLNSKDFKYRALVQDNGVSDVISKPLEPNELVTKIKSLLVC